MRLDRGKAGPVEDAVRHREDGTVAEEMDGDAMAFEIDRGDGGHEAYAATGCAWQASKVRFSIAASRSRPMKTSRLSRFSSSFHSRW